MRIMGIQKIYKLIKHSKGLDNFPHFFELIMKQINKNKI